jgi:hypothetical protein
LPFLLASVLVFAGVLCLPIKNWSAPVVLTVLGASQLVLHVSMQATLPSRAFFESLIGMGAMNGAGDVTGMTAQGVSGQGMVDMNTWPMVFAHIVAMLVAFVLIRSGDRAVAALFELLAVVVPTVRTVEVPVIRMLRVVAATEYRVNVVTRFIDVVVLRRGPPACLPTPSSSAA